MWRENVCLAFVQQNCLGQRLLPNAYSSIVLVQWEGKSLSLLRFGVGHVPYGDHVYSPGTVYYDVAIAECIQSNRYVDILLRQDPSHVPSKELAHIQNFHVEPHSMHIPDRYYNPCRVSALYRQLATHNFAVGPDLAW